METSACFTVHLPMAHKAAELFGAAAFAGVRAGPIADPDNSPGRSRAVYKKSLISSGRRDDYRRY